MHSWLPKKEKETNKTNIYEQGKNYNEETAGKHNRGNSTPVAIFLKYIRRNKWNWYEPNKTNITIMLYAWPKFKFQNLFQTLTKGVGL